MKSLKKLLSVLVVVTLMAAMLAVPVFAASLKYEDEAKVLYDLGLFKGKSETAYVPALEDRLLREEAVAVLLRMFKLEEEALKMDEKEAKDLLSKKFKDADEIASWAVKHVAYAVKNGVIEGRPDGKFAPKDNVLGREYAKMLLAMLGYKQDVDFEYKFSVVKLAEVCGLPMSEASRVDEFALLRDDVVGMSYYALTAEYVAGDNEGKKVIEVIVGDDAKLKEIALKAGLMEEPVIVSVETLYDIEIKVGETLELPKKVMATYSDGTKKEVEVTWPKVDTSKAMPRTQITGTIKGTDVVAKVYVTVKEVILKVESVTADNLIEVVVTYNLDVSENAAAANKDNYKLNNGKTVTNVSVSEKTVILKLDSAAGNQSKAKLTISNKILPETTEVEFTFFDATLPEVISHEITGPRKIELTFSEPIANSVDAKITVKSGTSTIQVNKAGITGWGTRKITVPLYSSFVDDKEYNVTVENFIDYAGYKNIIKTITFVYHKDATAPVATIDEAKQEYVKVTFNKPVTGLTINHFYHTFSAWTAMNLTTGDSYTSTAVNPTDSVKTVYVWFYKDGTIPASERPIAEGETTFTILTKAGSNEIKDDWGNKFVEATYTISVTGDKTPPEVKEIKVTTEQAFTVEFTKNVAAFTTDNLEVLDENGGSISGLSITITPISAKKFTVDLGKNLAGKTIIVNIKNVKDNTLNANKLALYSTTLSITDKTPPKVDKVTFEVVNPGASDESWNLYVFFNENVDAETALKPGNYYIYNSGYTKLTEATEFFAGDKIVKIKLTSSQKALITTGVTQLFVTNVKDTVGNEIVPVLVTIIAQTDPVNAPYMEKVEAVSVNTIEITFNEELATYDVSAFKVIADDATEPEISSFEATMSGAKTKIVITINGELPYNTSVAKVKIIERNAITNLFGVKPNTLEKTIADKISPKMDSITAGTATGTIAIKFTEPINNDGALVALIPTDLIIVRKSDNKTLEPGTDYMASVAGDTVTVTIKNEITADTIYKICSKDAITYIRDLKGNKATTFTTVKEVTVKENSAPKLTTTEFPDPYTKATLVFNENIINNTVDDAALKAAIKISSDGTTFVALDATDTVTINTNKLEVNFGTAKATGSYWIRIDAGALKDAAGNATAEITTGKLIVPAP